MYIDYQKAYDSVPHSWLLEVLKIYKIHPTIISFLESTITKWTTRLRLNTSASTIETDTIKIQRGIFQGDTLSPLWFCLALNPLSNLLNNEDAGYPAIYINTDQQTDIQIEQKHNINHLMYMDDIKLYASTQEELDQLAEVTERFSNDIGMKFGIDKCRINSIRAGQYYGHQYELQSGQIIEPLKENEMYKYLGYHQARQIPQKEIKDQLKQQFKHRLNSILKTNLNSKNTIKAINTYAIPVLTYSFGIINWSKTQLKSLQRLINTTMTYNRKHHPRSCIQRLTLPRYEGGRGLIDIINLHNKQITGLRSYFHHKINSSNLHKAIVKNDVKLTPLNLNSQLTQTNEVQVNKATKHSDWSRKPLHGRHYHDLNLQHVDKLASNEWLRRGELFPETEGFMIAIQDQVIETRNYRKHIMKIPTTQDICRKCHNSTETIQHITGACSAIVQTDYKHRHDQIANIIHQKLAIKHKLIDKTPVPYYKYIPETILENCNHKLYFDRAILTDRTVHYNRPDITMIDKVNKAAYLIDIAIPNTHNIQSTISHKINKYLELKDEITRMWNLRKVSIIPIVISTTGIVPTQLHQAVKSLDLPKSLFILLQKAVILNTCRITRKFLQTDQFSTTIHTTHIVDENDAHLA
ncbi:unnamed protein product [Colias eurytheme]|nr:unnamed protein product [Colias eurytheme]